MIASVDIGWAAGFLEGEGSFITSVGRVQAVQVQRDPLERLVRLFGGRIIVEAPWRSHEQAVNRWYLGSHDAAALMMTIYCLMSPRRRGQINAVLSRWKTLKIAERYKIRCPQGHPYDRRTKAGRRYCGACCRRHSRASRVRRLLCIGKAAA